MFAHDLRHGQIEKKIDFACPSAHHVPLKSAGGYRTIAIEEFKFKLQKLFSINLIIY
jgi:hypothetical protein